MVRQLQGRDLYEYGYAASGIQKHCSPNKLDFSKRHAGGGPETKDQFGVALMYQNSTISRSGTYLGPALFMQSHYEHAQ